jgi:hypothetical protein
MKTINLSNNEIAMVDDDEYEEISKYKWNLSNSGYAVRSYRENGKTKTMLMHRQIMCPPENMLVDHIDRNKLNNQKDNLRIASYKDNSHNTIPQSWTGYKGVDLQGNWWVAKITINGKQITVGKSKDIIEAAKKYDEAAKKYYGPFAYLNFPTEGDVKK